MGTTREGPFVEVTQEYQDYLDGPEWKKKREEKLQESGYKCEVCGKTKRLHVHHLTYERIFKEELADLMVLCQLHHESAEWLYRNGSLKKTGDVFDLKAVTLKEISALETTEVPVPKKHLMVDHEFWGITSYSQREEVVSILLQRKEFQEVLQRERPAAKSMIRSLAKKAGPLQPKMYINFLMTYDAYHGFGAYKKFRKEVLEIASRVGLMLHTPDPEEEEDAALPPRPFIKSDKIEEFVSDIRVDLLIQGIEPSKSEAMRLMGMISAWVGRMGANVA